MKKIYLICLFIAGLFSVNSNQAAHLSPNLLFTARLDGAQEAPPVTTNATGAASFILNATRDTMFVNVAVAGLSGAITGAHVHEGAIGVAGPVVTGLTNMVNGNTIRGIITGPDLGSAKIAKYLSGSYYINIHTAANPNGEIRGQIILETEYGFTARLNGAQEVPPVITTANGIGSFILSHDRTKIKINTIFEGLSGPVTGAHLHTGAVGTTGPVVLNLTSMVSGNMIIGEGSATGLLAGLATGTVYINIHTAANPNGEIRGQLVMVKGVAMDANLNGSQEVPPVSTNARGVASFRLNPTLDSMEVTSMVTGLSGAITGAHIHSGALGVAGPVVIDLTPFISGTRIIGKRSLTGLPANTINMLLSGDMYLNVHTAANPNGEIRGQVYRLAREGYTMVLNGAQENPPVTTTGRGGGFVSIDRDQSNANYMVVWSGLSGPATMAHFHLGKRGVNGPVLFNITPTFNNASNPTSASGYWSGNSTPPFATRNSVQFRSDSIYVNIHTAANPSGEIRGQVIRGAKDLARVLKSPSEISDAGILEVYPNPFSNNVKLLLKGDANKNATLKIIDNLGRTVFYTDGLFNNGSDHFLLRLSQLPNGMYYLLLTSENFKYSNRLIKE